MPLLDLAFRTSDPGLSVRHVAVRDGMSQLFEIGLDAVSPVDDLSIDDLAGARATFSAEFASLGGTRRWGGVCTAFAQVQAEDRGVATYRMTIRPSLWLLTQRVNCRIFQHMTTPEILQKLLGEWKIPATFEVDETRHPKHEYRVQYGETDFAFMSRLLEDAGISYTFAFTDDDGSVPAFDDQPDKREARGAAIAYVDAPHPEAQIPFLTDVVIERRISPGAFVIQDHDFRRRPDYPQRATATAEPGIEGKLEQFLYRPGAFLTEGTAGDGHKAASDDAVGDALARGGLGAARSRARSMTYRTNLGDLKPGTVLTMSGHPQRAAAGRMLVIASTLRATPGGAWHVGGEAVSADRPHVPEHATPRPRVHGVQSAIVTGASGEEIHTDDLGRVRVQFPWDREGKGDDASSCFLRVSQAWAGAGYGVMSIPRVGQEVTVGFFEGDPDQPIVLGRVHNVVNQVPYALPEAKTRTAWRSQSTPDSPDGHNELVFEDKAGAELIALRAERDLHKIVVANETERTGGARTTSVGRARSLTVGGVDSTVVGVRHVVAIGAAGGAPSTTSLEMTEKRIVATTGDATVTFDGADLTFAAKGNITIVSREGDVIIKGGPNVKINST